MALYISYNLYTSSWKIYTISRLSVAPNVVQMLLNDNNTELFRKKWISLQMFSKHVILQTVLIPLVYSAEETSGIEGWL